MLICGTPSEFLLEFDKEIIMSADEIMNNLAASYEVSTACNLYKPTQQAAGN
jgi:hypothetical protein